MKQRGNHRNVAINFMVAIMLSLVLNFSYLVFMMVGADREPAPERPIKPQVERVVEGKKSISEDVSERAQVESDSLRGVVIIREESIANQSRQRNGTHPMATTRGNIFMAIDIFFYMCVAMVFLTIMTDTSRHRRNRFIWRLVAAVAVAVVAYLLAPQMTWKGDIIVTANARHLFNPMTMLKVIAALIVCALYGKIYDLLYAKQAIEMEIERLKNENITWQYNTLVNQVNPHFLFNSLNSLSMLVREHKTDDALTYIGQMSDTYRYIIEEGQVEKTTVGEELGFVEAFGYLLKIRYAGKLHIRVDVPEEYRAWSLPPLSIQPLIENAVKHNTITSSLPMEITITAKEGYVVVSNIIHPKLQPEESTGIGLKNLSSRYELIVGRNIEVATEGDHFVVRLPLIAPQK